MPTATCRTATEASGAATRVGKKRPSASPLPSLPSLPLPHMYNVPLSVGHTRQHNVRNDHTNTQLRGHTHAKWRHCGCSHTPRKRHESRQSRSASPAAPVLAWIPPRLPQSWPCRWICDAGVALSSRAVSTRMGQQERPRQGRSLGALHRTHPMCATCCELVSRLVYFAA